MTSLGLGGLDIFVSKINQMVLLNLKPIIGADITANYLKLNHTKTSKF
jgi:hypothetical protein